MFDPMLSRERPDLGSVLRFTGALECRRSGGLGAARAASQIDAWEAWAAPSNRHSWAENLQGRLVSGDVIAADGSVFSLWLSYS